MNITSVMYTSDAQDQVFVNTDKGFLTVPWPSNTWHGDEIQAWIDAGNSIQEPPQPDIEQVREDKRAEINTAYKQDMKMILTQYPDAETLSFDKQETQARAWNADNSVATPYIDAMLAERPLDKQELVNRIIQKSDQFSAAHGAATGKRQRLEDDIDAATTLQELEAITW